MLASLDIEILGKLQDKVRYGVDVYTRNSKQLDELLGRFSSGKVKTAMRSVIDEGVLDKLRSERRYGARSRSESQRYVDDLLGHTSSAKVRRVFETIEPEQRTSDSSYRASYEHAYPGFDTSGTSFEEDTQEGGFSMRNFMRGVFARMRGVANHALNANQTMIPLAVDSITMRLCATHITGPAKSIQGLVRVARTTRNRLAKKGSDRSSGKRLLALRVVQRKTVIT